MKAKFKGTGSCLGREGTHWEVCKFGETAQEILGQGTLNKGKGISTQEKSNQDGNLKVKSKVRSIISRHNKQHFEVVKWRPQKHQVAEKLQGCNAGT